MKKVLAVLAVLVVGTLLTQFCPRPPVKPDHSVSDSVKSALDSMRIGRERFQRLLADSAKMWAELHRHDSIEALHVALADQAKAKRLSLRGPRTPALPDSSPADTARLLAELDTVSQERDLAVIEADEQRAARVQADSGKASLTRSTREYIRGAAEYVEGQIRAEGKLNLANARVMLLEDENAKLRRGCRIPLIGLKCPVIGAGLVMGAGFKPQPGIAVVIPL